MICHYQLQDDGTVKEIFIKTPERRLYYNPDGTVKSYTMEDLPGEYIVVEDQIFFESRYDLRVINGKIIRDIDNIRSKLRPVKVATETSTRCDPDNILLVVSENHPHKLWDKVIDQ